MKKHFIELLNILFGLIILPILLILVFVDLETIFNFDFSSLYTIGYFIYLFIGLLLFIGFRYININNHVLKEESLYTIKSIFYLSVYAIPSFFINHSFLIEHFGESNLPLRSYGKIAFLYLALALVVSPILTFIKNNKIRDNLILSRKILGILSFVFFVRHGLEYFTLEYFFQSNYHSDISFFQYVYDNLLLRDDALSGVIAGILMLFLGLTSNKIAIKLLTGKGWKLVQSLVYPAFIISVIHIAYASRFDNFYIFLFVFVVSLRTISYISKSNKKNSGVTTKYLCVPCGYIYDENIGDPDGGLEPGTKFEDIPDDWVCPVCGVTKKEFEPYYDSDTTIFGGYIGKVVLYTMLTEDVLEISIKLDRNVEVLKGQYAILLLKDFDGEFSRAYSIVDSKNNILTFGIKLKDTGRGGRLLKAIKVGDSIKVKGIYGEFVLQDTINQKVFIATGTGLAPIINMISGKLKSKANHLFFGVQAQKDLFYLDKINNVEDIDTHIYLSREDVPEYNYGRIDLTKYEFDKETEFYICGNPGVVTTSMDYLKESGYKNIFFEKFN